MTVHTAEQAQRVLSDLTGPFAVRTRTEGGLTGSIVLDAGDGVSVLLYAADGALSILTAEGHTAWTGGADVADLDESDVLASVTMDDTEGLALAAYALRRAGLPADEATSVLLADLAGTNVEPAERALLDAEPPALTLTLTADEVRALAVILGRGIDDAAEDLDEGDLYGPEEREALSARLDLTVPLWNRVTTVADALDVPQAPRAGTCSECDATDRPVRTIQDVTVCQPCHEYMVTCGGRVPFPAHLAAEWSVPAPTVREREDAAVDAALDLAAEVTR